MFVIYVTYVAMCYSVLHRTRPTMLRNDLKMPSLQTGSLCDKIVGGADSFECFGCELVPCSLRVDWCEERMSAKRGKRRSLNSGAEFWGPVNQPGGH